MSELNKHWFRLQRITQWVDGYQAIINVRERPPHGPTSPLVKGPLCQTEGPFCAEFCGDVTKMDRFQFIRTFRLPYEKQTRSNTDKMGINMANQNLLY